MWFNYVSVLFVHHSLTIEQMCIRDRPTVVHECPLVFVCVCVCVCVDTVSYTHLDVYKRQHTHTHTQVILMFELETYQNKFYCLKMKNLSISDA